MAAEEAKKDLVISFTAAGLAVFSYTILKFGSFPGLGALGYTLKYGSLLGVALFCTVTVIRNDIRRQKWLSSLSPRSQMFEWYNQVLKDSGYPQDYIIDCLRSIDKQGGFNV